MVEIAAALGVKHRQGDLPASVRDGLLGDLQRDARDQYWLIDVDQRIIVQAIGLTRQQKLRGYDAVHLACALSLRETLFNHGLGEPVMLSADRELAQAAQNEGLTAQDPNTH